MTEPQIPAADDSRIYRAPPGTFRISRVLRVWLRGSADDVVAILLKALLECRHRKWHRASWYLTTRLQRRHKVFIGWNTRFPADMILRHPVGIVLGEGVQIGRRVTIYQNVTLGGARIGDAKDLQNYPKIGDDCVIFAGAVLVGGITVGRNCVIGANAVVTQSIPDNSIAVGVPARVVRTGTTPVT